MNNRMSRFAAAVMIMAAFRYAQAYGPSFINLQTPSIYADPAIEFTIQHRFGRIIGEPQSSSFFDGADVHTGAAVHFLKRLSLYTDFLSTSGEICFGAGYSHSIIARWLTVDLRGYYSNYAEKGSRRSAAVLLADALSELAAERLWAGISGGYVAVDNYPLFGIGVILRTISTLDVIAEYCASYSIARSPPAALTSNTMSWGIQFATYGHRFKFIVGNSAHAGFRYALAGGYKNSYRFGFSIQRLFQW